MTSTLAIKPRSLIALAILLAGLAPIFLYWFFFGTADTVDIAEARRLLAESRSQSTLVDIRPSLAYASNHITGAENWPYTQITTVKNSQEVPASLRNRTLLLLCDSGLCSALAAKKLGSLGSVKALSVAGGMEAWLAIPSRDVLSSPIREMSQCEQVLAVITAFGVKPAYMHSIPATSIAGFAISGGRTFALDHGCLCPTLKLLLPNSMRLVPKSFLLVVENRRCIQS